MKQEPIAIVLGGTYPHISLIKKLKKRGYKILLVDYAENPIAKEFADEHILESSMDREKVLEISKKYNVDLVITTCSDQANVTACYVAEKLGLPAPYSYEVALSVTDKEIMKKKMIENDIPTSSFHIIDKNWKMSEFENLNYPIIVKPTDGYGSKGVRVANNADELAENIPLAIRESQKGFVIVEEYIVGTEIGIDCFVKEGKAHVVMTKHRHKIHDSKNEIEQIFGCTWPAVLSPELQTKIKKITNDIARAFSLKNTPLMIQAIVRENEIYVIEFGARIGGGNSYNIIKRHTGFDIIEASINSFLGIPVEIELIDNPFFYADVFLYMESSVFGYVANINELIDKKIAEDVLLTKKEGVLIGGDLASRNRIGSIILKADSLEQLFSKMSKAVSLVEIYDSQNNPRFRRELYKRIDDLLES